MSTLAHWSGPPGRGLAVEIGACAAHPRELRFGGQTSLAEQVSAIEIATAPPPATQKHNMPQLIIQKPIEGIKRKFVRRT